MSKYNHLLQIADLSVEFAVEHPAQQKVLKGLDLTLDEGATLGLVGESGSGKTLLAMAILGLLPENGLVTSGQINWKGHDLLSLNERGRHKVRGKEIAMIFQDPQASLNPLHPVGKQIGWLLKMHRNISSSEAMIKALELFEAVKLKNPKRCFYSFPRELSGGMCQRVMIAMALACQPKLLIADEPTSALDVTSAAGIVELLADVKQSTGLSILFITHDLGLAACMSDHIAVLDEGRIVDKRPVTEIFDASMHSMTRRLLTSYEFLSPKLSS